MRVYGSKIDGRSEIAPVRWVNWVEMQVGERNVSEGMTK